MKSSFLYFYDLHRIIIKVDENPKYQLWYFDDDPNALRENT